MKKKLVGLGFVVLALAGSFFYSPSCLGKVLLEKNNDLPLTVFNVTFRTGSADDPQALRGLANLTARLVREGGVKALGDLPALSRSELEKVLFPLAADISVSVNKEQTSFSVVATADNGERVFALLRQVLQAPALDPVEFKRIKEETKLSLTQKWPQQDQEELGKAALDRVIYGADHPYSHVVEGTLAGVEAATIDDVKVFAAKMYSRRRLTVGVTGVVGSSLEAAIKNFDDSLPEGESTNASLPAVPQHKNRTLTIVKGEFEGTGVHLGHPIALTRAGEDFPAMFLANNAYGKHRDFIGRLMRIVRQIRSMNYGTYSYIEDFPNGGTYLSPQPQVARSQQAFTVWGRPTTAENGCFLLRLVARETTKLATEGLTEEEFKRVQKYLIGNIPITAAGIEMRLGISIDSEFYGITADYLANLQAKVAELTYDQVNAAIKKYIHPDSFQMVVVTKDPDAFAKEISGDTCDITYKEGIEIPSEILEEDKKIAVYDVGVEAAQIQVVPAASLFQ
ncbi:MAG: insulinase family protein [Bdellovibrionales bacterium]|nr:insulinase family protein [Bdellovibrionales bacterium]